MVITLGKITDTAGAATTLTPDSRFPTAYRILFRAIKTATNLVSIGKPGFTPGGAGMMAEVQVTGTSGFSDGFEVISDGANTLTVADYAVKPAVNGEGVYVTYWTR